MGVDLSGLMSDFSFSGISFSAHMKGYVRPESVASIVLGLFFITVLASLWPAVRAARLDPIEALRYE